MADQVRVPKVELPLDKREWAPPPLPGQVVLVTTLGEDGAANVAPKSWVSMAAFGPPPVLMFGCTLEHATARNAVAGGAFVVNIPGREMLDAVWRCGSDGSIRGAERWAACGLTPIPSRRVAPPCVAECRAHLECETDGTREYGREVAVFGRIVSVSVDENVVADGEPARYRALAPFFFLENGWAAGLGSARRVGGGGGQADHSLTILAVSTIRTASGSGRSRAPWQTGQGR